MTDSAAPPAPLDAALLPAGVRARIVPGVNGLAMHLLEAGHDRPAAPLVLLLHGFPELAWSWRKVIPALAAAGYHVVAPDLRGYGRTTGCDTSFHGDVRQFRMFNLVVDVLCLVRALGRERVHAVVGHDFGSPLAAWCALSRPDVFPAVALMSAPFAGAPALDAFEPMKGAVDIHLALAALERPRKHYQWYYSTAEADAHMRHCPQGLQAFLRAYYHHKSADWPGNQPEPLGGWTAAELARLPTYYIMDLHEDMAATVAPHMPGPAQVAACGWLTEAELAVYAGEFARTGFQGGLQWYRCMTSPAIAAELRLFAGLRIEVPALFVAGRQDWGVYQRPGDFERMRAHALPNLRGCHLVEGAGHWVQQEQAGRVNELLLEFLANGARGA
jgi:pimeloyl-ACP methyl ester carboxylesterase